MDIHYQKDDNQEAQAEVEGKKYISTTSLNRIHTFLWRKLLQLQASPSVDNAIE